ncbi:MAG: GNAT family N-acetyltransferase [Candidatus Hodarchaeales archaeon]|jgi:predicted acetyltransferase
MTVPSKIRLSSLSEDIGMEIRQLNSDDRENFARLMRYAFEPTKNTYDKAVKEDWEDTQPHLKDMSQCYGCFDGEAMVSVSAFFESTVIIRKKEIPFGGVWGVATAPHYRNQGLIRLIFKQMLQEMNLKGIPLSILYPFKFSFYERFGYKMANEVRRYQIEVNEIITRPVSDRSVSEVFSLEDIKPIYREIAGNSYNYMVKRTEEDWRRRINPERPGYFFVCYDDNKKPKGYLIAQFQEREAEDFEKSEETIYLAEIFWTDRKTRQALFNFLKDHTDHRRYVLFGSADPCMLSYVENPRVKQTDIFAGSMARIVNVKDILEGFDYPSEEDASFVMQVKDSFCEWNNSSFSCNLDGGKVTIAKTSNSADVSIEIGALTQMIVGYRTASQLHESWEIESSPQLLQTLDRLFPNQNNFFRDFF